MAKQKLTKAEKIGIINSIVQKAFSKRHDALVKSCSALADEVYEQQFGKAEASVIRALKSRKAAIALIGGVTEVKIQCNHESRRYELCIDGINQIKEGRYGKRAFRGVDMFSLKHARVLFVSPASNRYQPLKLVPTGALVAKVQAQREECEKFYRDINAFQRDTYSIVMGCTTAERLIELVPEAKPFIPKPSGQLTTAMVPVDTVKRVRDTIAKSSS